MVCVPCSWWHPVACQIQGQSDVGVVTLSSPSVLEDLGIPGRKEMVGNWRYCFASKQPRWVCNQICLF